MAGDGDTERLVVLVEARVRDLERNMQRAAGTTDTSYNRMRRGSRSATRQMEGDMSRSTMRINRARSNRGLSTVGRTMCPEGRSIQVWGNRCPII